MYEASTWSANCLWSEQKRENKEKSAKRRSHLPVLGWDQDKAKQNTRQKGPLWFGMWHKDSIARFLLQLYTSKKWRWWMMGTEGRSGEKMDPRPICLSSINGWMDQYSFCWSTMYQYINQSYLNSLKWE